VSILRGKIPNGISAKLHRVLLVNQLPFITKLGLFAVFTVVLVVLTVIFLPKLVVLGPWGYVAGFIINCVNSALIVFPGPGFAAIIVMAKDLNPFLLGLVAGIGGALGELSGYWLGAQGRESMGENRFYALMLRGMTRFGGVILFSFSLIPFLPVDAGGILAGAARYPITKFLVYVGIGKILKSVAILYLAAKAFEWAAPYSTWLS